MKILKSFRNALLGIRLMITKELNALIHLAITIIVIIVGFVYKISIIEWMILMTTIGSVLAMEAMNTAIEHICDFIHIKHHPIIGAIKDLASGAVLILTIAAVVIGLLVFIPKIDV